MAASSDPAEAQAARRCLDVVRPRPTRGRVPRVGIVRPAAREPRRLHGHGDHEQPEQDEHAADPQRALLRQADLAARSRSGYASSETRDPPLLSAYSQYGSRGSPSGSRRVADAGVPGRDERRRRRQHERRAPMSSTRTRTRPGIVGSAGSNRVATELGVSRVNTSAAHRIARWSAAPRLRRQAGRDDVGVGVAAQQHDLEEREHRRPDRGRAAVRGQEQPADERLHGEQEERRQADRRPEHERGRAAHDRWRWRRSRRRRPRRAACPVVPSPGERVPTAGS